ncbi:MAG: adenylate/guanylate cyclase domain-containing protein [Patescibacteria group bacterium]
MFSIITGAAHAFALSRKTKIARLFSESVISFANVAVFVFTYFYFDLTNEYRVDGVFGADLQNRLKISEFPAGFVEFLEDPVHGFFLAGALVLALSMTFARARILSLQEKVTELLGTYVGGSVKDKLLDSRHPRSQKKTATILFSDIRSFTSMSEKSTPEEIVAFLNEYFTLWDEAVASNGGWIDKFIGDAVMAVFDGSADESQNAKAALSCSERVFELLPQLKKGIFSNGNIGIGIHSGELVMGDVGSASRRNFTVIGDTVNAASRLEGLCKEYGATLIVSESVRNLVGSRRGLECLGEAEIRGKSEPMKIYGK